LSYNPISK